MLKIEAERLYQKFQDRIRKQIQEKIETEITDEMPVVLMVYVNIKQGISMITSVTQNDFEEIVKEMENE